MVLSTPLASMKIADSVFLGFCFPLESTEEVRERQKELKVFFPDASHIPAVWYCGGESNVENNGWNNLDDKKDVMWDEDEEPENSIGPGMALEFSHFFAENCDVVKQKLSDGIESNGSGKVGLMIGIVRSFGGRLLGVTCGRLGGCYKSILRQTLHRHFFPNDPFQVNFEGLPKRDIYGMGAGDCELILNVVEENLPLAATKSDSNDSGTDALPSLEDRILSELQFDGFKGAAGEELPRLQNLQADLSTGFIPIYRYPGNYSGDEWTTFEWSSTSLQLKEAVEERLKPLVNQTMNHCVTNYYRDGTDFIAHHSDKDFDLNKDAVIVSVSLGDTRVMELRRRAEPRDTVRVILPHRSMLVLGPNTNREWTHSILQKENNQGIRLSLTLRDVVTFRDLRTGRLFGDCVTYKTLDEVRARTLVENAMCFAGFCVLSTSMASRKGSTAGHLAVTGAFLAGVLGLKALSNAIRNKREEQDARDFFSRTSTSGTKY